MAVATAYRINNSPLLIPPTKGRWVDRKDIGLDGTNRKIYVPTYRFILSFDALTFAQFEQIYDAWLNVAGTGTISVTIPEKGGADYDTFKTYTGVVPDEPESKEHHQKHLLNVEWVFRNITV